MGLTRQEVNLRRLLAKCELMCKSNQKNDERFGKYVSSLDDMFQEVKKLADSEAVSSYQKRITSIKVQLGIVTNLDSENDVQLMRQELLGLRHRKAEKLGDSDDLDQLINYHEDVQKKITDDMLTFTKSLKEQSELASKIIKKDTEVVGRATQLTDQNFTKLTTESAKLAEHSKRACRCWMWIMLVIVLVVFINMVLFMKVMKKKPF